MKTPDYKFPVLVIHSKVFITKVEDYSKGGVSRVHNKKELNVILRYLKRVGHTYTIKTERQIVLEDLERSAKRLRELG